MSQQKEKTIHQYFNKSKRLPPSTGNENCDLEITTKKLKIDSAHSNDFFLSQSQKSTCQKSTKSSELKICDSQDQDSMNYLDAIENMLQNDREHLFKDGSENSAIILEESDPILESQVSSEVSVSSFESLKFDLKALLQNIPFATATYNQDLRVKSKFFQHSKSKVAPTLFSSLLIPTIPLFGIDINLLSCLILLTGLDWLPKVEDSLKEFNRMTLFKEAHQTAGYLMKIEVEHKTSMKDFMKIDPKEFLRFMSVEAPPLEETLIFLKITVNNDSIIEEYLEKRDSMRIFFGFNSLITSYKGDSTKFKFYWAFNSSDFTSWPYISPNAHKDKFAQLNSTYDLHYDNLPPKMIELFILEHLVSYLTGQNGLINEDDNLYGLAINIHFHRSSNPYFYFADLLYGLFQYDEISLQFYSLAGCQDVLLRSLFNTKEPIDLLTVKKEIFKKLCAYKPILVTNQTKLNSLIINNNAKKAERCDKIGDSCKILFEKANNLDNWLPRDKNGLPIIPKAKNDVDELILKPALLQIARGDITAQNCYEYISRVFLTEDNKAGEEVRQKFKYIKASLFNLEAEIGNSPSFRERRELFGEFITNFTIDGVSYDDEINEILIHPLIDQLYLAIEEFILLTMGPEFVFYYLHVVLAFDQSTVLSKAPGALFIGGSNLGKSTFFSLLLKPFSKLYLTNTRTQNISFNQPIPENKTIELDAHVVLFDDFSCGFDKGNKMATSVFNLMNDWTRNFFTINIKNFTCFLKKKAPIWVICHHPLEELEENHDASFFSRFSCIVNFNDPIIKSKNLPSRLHNETEDSYMNRLIQLDLAYPRPLFPLRLKNNNIFIEFNAKSDNINTQLFKKIGTTIPLASKTAVKFKEKVLDRESELKKNPISKKWLQLPEVSEVQCSYLINKVLVSLWDRIYPTLGEETRESIFPLQSGRSLLNIEEHGLEFSHSNLNPKVFNPSLIFSKPKLLESPQVLMREIFAEVPNILIAKRKEF